MTAVDWGNVPSWISAIGSLSAFGTAVWAARAAWSQVKHSDDQQRSRYKLEEQAQASKVAAWLSAEKDHEGRPTVYLKYVNKSDLPVYSLAVIPDNFRHCRFTIDLIEPQGEIRAQWIDSLTQEVNKRYNSQFHAFLAAFTNGAGIDNPTSSAEEAAFMNSINPLNSMQYRFRDTQNIVWKRDMEGILRKARVDSDGDDVDDPDYQSAKEARHRLRNAGVESYFLKGMSRG